MFLTCFVVFYEIYFVDIQLFELFIEKKDKKVLVSLLESSTFAPAKRRRGAEFWREFLRSLKV